jgi:hypothetical protein
MWQHAHPAPQSDDSVSVPRPSTSPGAPAPPPPAPPPARTPSGLRRVVRVLIPTVVAGAVVAGFAAVALSTHVLGIGAPGPTSDCTPLPSGTSSGAVIYTPRATPPAGSGSGNGGGATQANPGQTITIYKAPASNTTRAPAQTGAGTVHVCGVGFHAHSAVRFSLSHTGATAVQIPQAVVTTDGTGSFSAHVPAVFPANCGGVQLHATDAQGTTATLTIPSRNLGIPCAVP